jgi:hypothetical protein
VLIAIFHDETKTGIVDRPAMLESARTGAMKTAIACLLFLSVLCAQSKPPSTSRHELFTRSFSITTPIVETHIPVETCHAIISEADSLVSGNELKKFRSHDLQIASENLRACATSNELDRIERDLAVGLYGEVVFQLERYAER